MHIKSIHIALFTLVAFSLSAQSITEGETFPLSKKGAHYVFTASINGTAEATIKLSSGLRLIDQPSYSAADDIVLWFI